MLKVAAVIIYSNVLCSGGSRVLSICSSVAQSWKRELTWPRSLHGRKTWGVSASWFSSDSSSAQVLHPGQANPVPHGPCWFPFLQEREMQSHAISGCKALQHRHCNNSPHFSAHGLGWWLGHLATKPVEAEPCPPCSRSSPPRQGAHM